MNKYYYNEANFFRKKFNTNVILNKREKTIRKLIRVLKNQK